MASGTYTLNNQVLIGNDQALLQTTDNFNHQTGLVLPTQTGQDLSILDPNFLGLNSINLDSLVQKDNQIGDPQHPATLDLESNVSYVTNMDKQLECA
ncbi:hypothetical protein Cni_G00447 [Canna indica]|uniref:Uncharacterized protein n=1 Tax=Canna indica TaxID=4628 RepID=A0AAQ3JLB1_9LILI|nr:hypothetical protein Cni_G00447 [Canna indica]